jgi:hypothetical protein
MMQHRARWTHPLGLPHLASGLLAAALTVGTVPAAPSQATAELDCAAIGRRAVQVDLATAAGEIRHVALRPGETLRFTFEAEPGPFGILTLIEGAESPRVLLVGPSGAAASFTAETSGAFGFQFTKDGAVAGRFTVACGSVDELPGGGASARAPASQPDGLPLDSSGFAAEGLQIADLEPSVSSQGLGELAPKGAATAGQDTALAARQAGTGPQMKLQWLDQRYRLAGPEGPQIDPNASGVEIGVNYKLQSIVTIGALAQVNPAAEMLLGGQRSLLDQGWMAGPVTSIQFAPGLVLDARAAWGEGVSGLDEAAVTAAQRRLVSARLANEHAFGAWRFTPAVNFNYVHETPPGSGPATEATPPHAGAAGRIDVGPALAYRTDLTSSAFIEPRVLVGGFWNFEDLAKDAAKDAAGPLGNPQMRLKAEAGLTFGFYNGPKLQALGALEAGDRETPDAWTGRLQLNLPLK